MIKRLSFALFEFKDNLELVFNPFEKCYIQNCKWVFNSIHETFAPTFHLYAWGRQAAWRAEPTY